MKKSFLLGLMLICAIMGYAQNDVTTFLGIPVDGFKKDMEKALMEKGYKKSSVIGSDCFEGEFNGMDVNIFISTNNNKVCRLMICDKNTQDERNIKIRFNKLVSQFEKNKRYTYFDSYTIPDSVDIFYEMTVNNKVFEAIYYQELIEEKIDTVKLKQKIKKELFNRYSQEQLDNPTEEIKKELNDFIFRKTLELYSYKPVWFRIIKHLGQYYIAMYYDNEYNRANGEDL